jgi:hypothetical protein
LLLGIVHTDVNAGVKSSDAIGHPERCAFVLYWHLTFRLPKLSVSENDRRDLSSFVW